MLNCNVINFQSILPATNTLSERSFNEATCAIFFGKVLVPRRRTHFSTLMFRTLETWFRLFLLTLAYDKSHRTTCPSMNLFLFLRHRVEISSHYLLCFRLNVLLSKRERVVFPRAVWQLQSPKSLKEVQLNKLGRKRISPFWFLSLSFKLSLKSPNAWCSVMFSSVWDMTNGSVS